MDPTTSRYPDDGATRGASRGASAVASTGILGTLTHACATHASHCVAIIAALVFIIIAILVYHRGVFGFGPYARPLAGRGHPRADKKDDVGPPDPETEKLIQTINSQ